VRPQGEDDECISSLRYRPPDTYSANWNASMTAGKWTH
jgi:hypothetical protein